MDTESVKKIFDTHDGIMRTKELSECGIYYKLLSQLMQEGYVEKIRYGYYQWQDDRSFSEAATIATFFLQNQTYWTGNRYQKNPSYDW